MSATTHRHTTTEVTILRVSVAEINTDSISDELRDELNAESQHAGGGSVVVDMSAVKYLNSTGIRAFVTLNKRVRERGGRTVLAGLTENVQSVFEAVKILTGKGHSPSTMEHYADVPAAVAAIYRMS